MEYCPLEDPIGAYHRSTREQPTTLLRVGSQDAVPITGLDEEQTRLAQFPLQPYAEITVSVSTFASPISATLALQL